MFGLGCILMISAKCSAQFRWIIRADEHRKTFKSFRWVSVFCFHKEKNLLSRYFLEDVILTEMWNIPKTRWVIFWDTTPAMISNEIVLQQVMKNINNHLNQSWREKFDKNSPVLSLTPNVILVLHIYFHEIHEEQMPLQNTVFLISSET